MATLQGELFYERFGVNGSIAVISRAWLSHCYAELGAFTEGLAMAAEGLRVAKVILSCSEQHDLCRLNCPHLDVSAVHH